ncbi:MAG: DNA/RNA nuclease SfsA [Agarilytica sp.]
MKFTPALVRARFLRRYKRFLVDVELGGERVTVHCPNTGSMTNCLVEGSDCWLMPSDNPKRKYRFGLELVTTTTGHIAGVNTLRANGLVEEALRDGVISELASFEEMRREVKINEKSRIDFQLTQGDQQCFLEVKSVTLSFDGLQGLFPDTKSVRALKHVKELISLTQSGHKAALLFCVQHSGVRRVAPAVDIYPEYALALKAAQKAGVSIVAYAADISEQEIRLTKPLPVIL